MMQCGSCNRKWQEVCVNVSGTKQSQDVMQSDVCNTNAIAVLSEVMPLYSGLHGRGSSVEFDVFRAAPHAAVIITGDLCFPCGQDFSNFSVQTRSSVVFDIIRAALHAAAIITDVLCFLPSKSAALQASSIEA